MGIAAKEREAEKESRVGKRACEWRRPYRLSRACDYGRSIDVRGEKEGKKREKRSFEENFGVAKRERRAPREKERERATYPTSSKGNSACTATRLDSPRFDTRLATLASGRPVAGTLVEISRGNLLYRAERDGRRTNCIRGCSTSSRALS